MIGFGLIKRRHPPSTFNKPAELAYFIISEYTGQGLGQIMLDFLENKALKHSINVLLASISSLNEMSVHFHIKNGYNECGRFILAGHKLGRDFDII
jgi:L-amino acid N-acyltransferase YncA